jgi:hypothetical protein
VDGLTCDGNLTPVWTTEGRPVNVGRSQRVVPHRTKVLVDDRDRGCRFPGCGSTASVEVHHLVHWRDGGATDLANLLSLCPFHHDAHHRGEFTVVGDPAAPEGLEFTTRLGRPIGPMRRTVHTGSLAEPTGSGGQARPVLSTGPPVRPGAGPDCGAPPGRPRPRLGRRYAAPTGGVLHLGLVDFTPPRRHPLRT